MGTAHVLSMFQKQFGWKEPLNVFENIMHAEGLQYVLLHASLSTTNKIIIAEYTID